MLLSERIDDQVASVNATTGKANEYTLMYAVRYQLEGARVLGPEVIRLQRDYHFDPARVVAKEYEQRELLNNMRREAAMQITRRLAHATVAP